MTCLFETMLSVVPSGADFTSADVPTMPPAPAWFSTITGAPSALDSAGEAARVIVSTPDAVATGRMNLIGRSLCANAPMATIALTSARATPRARAPALRRCGDGRLFESFVGTERFSFLLRVCGGVARRDGALCHEAVDRFIGIADAAQRFAHVLADLRRIEAHAQALSLHHDRKQRRPYRLSGALAG